MNEPDFTQAFRGLSDDMLASQKREIYIKLLDLCLKHNLSSKEVAERYLEVAVELEQRIAVDEAYKIMGEGE